jgi:hypothetical protein
MERTDSQRRAAATLAVLVVIAVLAQPLSVVARERLLPKSGAGLADYLWRDYAAAPRDVVFVGDSRVLIGTDSAAVEAGLRMRGLSDTVTRLAVPGADVTIQQAIVYRVMHLSKKPRLVVLSFSEYMYTRPTAPDPTGYLWQLTEPYDLGYMRLAYDLDPNRGRLLRGWIAPIVANAPVLARAGREQASSLPPVRWILGDSSAPSAGPAELQFAVTDAPMSPEKEVAVLESYRQDFGLGSFRFAAQRLEWARAAVHMAREAGVDVRFVIYPVYGIDRINPTGYADYLDRVTALARELQVPLADLHAVDQNRDHYFDPSHLNREGVLALAPRLAEVAAS